MKLRTARLRNLFPARDLAEKADVSMGTVWTIEAGRELPVLRSLINDSGGTPVEGKVLGDGVLAVFTSARQAIDCALHCDAAGEPLGLQLHLGIHAGDVIREGNNVYGGAGQYRGTHSGCLRAG